MTPARLERDWARLGVLLNVRPAPATPDIERVLLDTARRAPGHPRLVPLAVTWLARHGWTVARHRLKGLVPSALEPKFQPVLGLVIEEAVAHGAPRDLLIAAAVCRVASPPRPLAEVQRENLHLERVATRNASPRSRRWGLLHPEVELKPEALRPVEWVWDRNPGLRDRAKRKGDLRCSILETLRRDLSGASPSESHLARLCGVTRSAAAKALADLVCEGEVVIHSAPAQRNHPVVLRTAA